METINLYRRLLALQMRAQLQYPVSFGLEIVVNAIVIFTYFLGAALVLQRFGHIGGWALGEIAFLWGMVEVAFGAMDMIFSGFDPGNFGQQVRLGRFDQLLLRLGRISQGIVIFGLALTMTDIVWTPLKLLYLPLVWLGLICFLGDLFILTGKPLPPRR